MFNGKNDFLALQWKIETFDDQVRTYKCETRHGLIEKHQEQTTRSILEWQYGSIDQEGNICEMRRRGSMEVSNDILSTAPFDIADEIIFNAGHKNSSVSDEKNIIVAADAGPAASNEKALRYLRRNVREMLVRNATKYDKKIDIKLKLESIPKINENIMFGLPWSVSKTSYGEFVDKDKKLYSSNKPKYMSKCAMERDEAVELHGFYEQSMKAKGKSKGEFRMEDPISGEQTIFRFLECPSVNIGKNGCNVKLKIERIESVDRRFSQFRYRWN